MFQFPGFASRFGVMPPLRTAGCPIRKSAHLGVFASPRGLSQLVTSFFASESQGILHVPLSPFFFPFIREYQGLRPLSAALLVFFCFARVRFLLFSTSMSSSLKVENNGFEPLTPCVQSRCSSQLS